MTRAIGMAQARALLALSLDEQHIDDIAGRLQKDVNYSTQLMTALIARGFAQRTRRAHYALRPCDLLDDALDAAFELVQS